MNESKEKSAVGIGIPSTESENYTTDIMNHAIEKINPKSIKNANRYMAAVAEPVAKALHGFCRQSEEFAGAVTKTEKTVYYCNLFKSTSIYFFWHFSSPLCICISNLQNGGFAF